MTMYESGNARGKQAQAKRFTAVLAASLLTGLAGPSLHGQAEAPLNVLETILESPDFGGVKKTWGIGFKIKETNQKQFSVPADFSLIKKIAAAALFTALSLGISAGAACAAVYLYNRRRAGEGKQAPPDQGAAYRAAGAEGQAYWLGLSRERFAAGREREAWAACLNAWAAWMQDSPGAGAGKKVPAGATEYDLRALLEELLGELKKDRESAAEITREFAGFLDQWLLFAYAGTPPEPGAFEARLRFCEALGGGGGHG